MRKIDIARRHRTYWASSCRTSAAVGHVITPTTRTPDRSFGTLGTCLSWHARQTTVGISGAAHKGSRDRSFGTRVTLLLSPLSRSIYGVLTQSLSPLSRIRKWLPDTLFLPLYGVLAGTSILSPPLWGVLAKLHSSAHAWRHSETAFLLTLIHGVAARRSFCSEQGSQRMARYF